MVNCVGNIFYILIHFILFFAAMAEGEESKDEIVLLGKAAMSNFDEEVLKSIAYNWSKNIYDWEGTAGFNEYINVLMAQQSSGCHVVSTYNVLIFVSCAMCVCVCLLIVCFILFFFCMVFVLMVGVCGVSTKTYIFLFYFICVDIFVLQML